MNRLISVKPRFADAIIAGSKTVELRRRPLNVVKRSRLVFYATAPVKAIVAVATVAALDFGTPEELWERYGPVLALSKEEFDNYFTNNEERGYAYLLNSVRELPKPVPLQTMRQH